MFNKKWGGSIAGSNQSSPCNLFTLEFFPRQQQTLGNGEISACIPCSQFSEYSQIMCYLVYDLRKFNLRDTCWRLQYILNGKFQTWTLNAMFSGFFSSCTPAGFFCSLSSKLSANMSRASSSSMPTLAHYWWQCLYRNEILLIFTRKVVIGDHDHDSVLQLVMQKNCWLENPRLRYRICHSQRRPSNLLLEVFRIRMQLGHWILIWIGNLNPDPDPVRPK